MPTASLTDRKIDSLKPGKQLNQWFDKKVVGFGVRISQEGTKTSALGISDPLLLCKNDPPMFSVGPLFAN